MKSELTLKNLIESHLKTLRPKIKTKIHRRRKLIKSLTQMGFIYFRGKKLKLILREYKSHNELMFQCSCGHPCRKFFLPELTCLKCNKEQYQRYPKTPLGRLQMCLDRATRYPSLAEKYIEKAYSHAKILNKKIKA